MTTNCLEKWANGAAEQSVIGKKKAADGQENLDLKLTTLSSSKAESVPVEAAFMQSTSDSHFSSSTSRFADRNFLSNATPPPSVNGSVSKRNESNAVEAAYAKETPSNEEPAFREEKTTTTVIDNSRTKFADMGIGQRRSNVPSAIPTASGAEIVNQTPTRLRKNAFVEMRHAGSASASPAATTPSTPVGGNGAGTHRFKFPAVKMGGFLFRKKSSWPTLNYAAMAAANAAENGDRSPSPAEADRQQQKLAIRKGKGIKNADVDNGSPRRPKFYNNVGAGGGNITETSPLLKRINNRLQQDRSKRFSTASNYRNSCYCMSAENHCDCFHRQNSTKRCASKEDPGPRTEANNLSAMNDVMASLMVEEMANSSCTGSSGACNKSASYPTAFGSFGHELDAGWNSGSKYKLVKEGQIQVCRLTHPRTVLGKLTSSKLLRRWETHILILDADEIKSKTPNGFLDKPIKYSSMEDVHALPQWDSSGDKHCVRIFVPEGSVLLQTNHMYARNQWLYSIQWRRNIYRHRRLIESNCNRPEVLLKEIKCMVEQAMRTPLQGDHMSLKPVRLACMVLTQINEGHLPKTMTEPVLVCVSPLLDTVNAVAEISPWLSKYCEECPRSRIIDDTLSDVAHLTLKKNMDFGKYISARLFSQDFLLALYSQNGGLERVKNFVRNAHGQSSTCPHPRVLPNLVSVCLAAIHALYDSSFYGTKTTSSPSMSAGKQSQQSQPITQRSRVPAKVTMTSLMGGDTSSLSSGSMSGDDRQSIGLGQYAACNIGNRAGSCVSSPSILSVSSSAGAAAFMNFGAAIDRSAPEFQAIVDQRLPCFCTVLETISEFEDWRVPLASLLQPIPFPEEVLANDAFSDPFSRLIRRVGTDTRCEVHLAILGVREGKEGWFHLVCPGGPCCVDDGDLFACLLKTLLHCCCRRKKFLQSLNGMLGPLQLLSLRECEPAMEALCHMLELEVVEGEDLKLQMITALQSTTEGKRQYAALCDRQIALRELQQKGGPRKLTLPSKSTDADLAVLLSSGSFGNLEWLSLAFTNVTSACAEYLIKLPSLRYLNLWSTQFGDHGLQTISEHLNKLQVLNLCETPVTDKGLSSLTALTNLRKLNLNSTQLSAKTFQILRAKLPALQEVDVRYTDAWCADEVLGWS